MTVRSDGPPPHAVLVLAGATVLAQIAYPLVGPGAARDALTVSTVLLFAATSLVHAATSRGWPAAVTLLAVCGGGGLLAEAVGVATGTPFGQYSYAGSLGSRLLGVPLVVPLAWTMMAWPAYLVGRLLGGKLAERLNSPRTGGPRRGGRPLGGAVAVLLGGWALASWDLFLDPQMVSAGHWRWAFPTPHLPGVPTVPLTNYAGWLLVALAMMAALGRWLPATAPVPSRSDLVPLGLYLWTWSSSVIAHAVFFGLPASSGWGGFLMGLVAVPLALVLWAGRRPVGVVS